MNILEIKNLNHFFGGLKAISNFNIQIKKDTIHGIIGPNGAGKTTLFNIITGLYRPSNGEILFEGINLIGKKPFQISRLGIARTFQNLRLFNELTVLENILIGELQQHNHFWQKNELNKNIYALLEIFDLENRANEKASNLPYGIQRKLEIARALATEPKLILLDEPAAGMNPQEVLDLVELIKNIKKRFNLTIILIEHQMKLVEMLCDFITVMNFGQVIAEGKTQDVQNNPLVIKAYLGEREVS